MFYKIDIARRSLVIPRKGNQHAQAFTLVEVVIAVALIAVTAIGATQAMLAMNSHAMTNRVLTNARVIVQDQINGALTVDYVPAAAPPIIPSILETGTTTAEIPITVDPQGNTTIQGTITRTVEPVNNPLNVAMRRVTCRVEYSFLGRDFEVQLSTIRSPDMR